MKKSDLLDKVWRDTSDAESELTTLSYDELLDIAIKNRLSPLEIPHHRAQLLGVLQQNSISVIDVQRVEDRRPADRNGDERLTRLIGWCSWCQLYCVHVETTKNYVRRSVFACASCLSKTLTCDRFGECSGLSRGFTLWNEDECLVCAARTPAWESWEPIAVARCDWCRQISTHVLERKGGRMFRDIYVCLACNGRGVPCTGLGGGSDGPCTSFARSHTKSDDDLCSLCARIPPEMMVLHGRRCSWCLELSNHVLHEYNTLSRTVYACSHCSCKTVPCR